MECLDELSLGVRGQITGKDKDCLPVASPTATIDHMASMSDAPQTLFDAPHQTLVHISPALRQEQDPSLSELKSWDLLPGVPLCAVLPTFALR